MFVLGKNSIIINVNVMVLFNIIYIMFFLLEKVLFGDLIVFFCFVFLVCLVSWVVFVKCFLCLFCLFCDVFFLIWEGIGVVVLLVMVYFINGF